MCLISVSKDQSSATDSRVHRFQAVWLATIHRVHFGDYRDLWDAERALKLWYCTTGSDTIHKYSSSVEFLDNVDFWANVDIDVQAWKDCHTTVLTRFRHKLAYCIYFKEILCTRLFDRIVLIAFSLNKTFWSQISRRHLKVLTYKSQARASQIYIRARKLLQDSS